MSGWIKIHRQIQNCWIYKDKKFDKTHAWLDLLLMAYFTEKSVMVKGNPVVIPRGSFPTSIEYLSKRWGWNRKTVMGYLNTLETDNMILQKRTSQGTTITIVNYGNFQDVGTTDRTTERTPVGTPERTPERTQYKKEKNNKEIKKENKESFGEYKNVKLTLSEYDRLGDEFGTEKRDKAIRYLDEYIEDKGYKSKSHNLAIRRWVFKALDEHKPKNNFMKAEISHDEIENLYAN